MSPSPRHAAPAPTAGPLHAVLFDATGTLIALREPVGETYSRFARRFGSEVPAARLDEAFERVRVGRKPCVFPGTSHAEGLVRERAWWRSVVDDTFRAADGSAVPAPFDACFDALWEHYASAEAWQPTPGALEALSALRAAGLPLGVVSNFDQRLRKILEGLGIHGFLDVVVIPADAGVAKPDALIFHVALKRLGLAGHQVAYVGNDAAHDVAGARGAELRPIDATSLATLADLPRVLGLGDTRAR